MREKLTTYVQSLFRDAFDCPENRDLQAEILQNSLDRYDDLIARGIPEAQAYAQTVDSIGDVTRLLKTGYAPQVTKKKKHRGQIAIVACVLVLLVVLLPIAGRRLVGFFVKEPSREDDHWGSRMEEELEQWVDQMDDEFGFSVLLPNSTYDYMDAERYRGGETEIPAEELKGEQLSLGIDWLAGTVTVQTWDRDTILLEETGDTDEKSQLHWRLENDKLDIQYCASGRHETLPSKDLTVTLPEYLAENLQRVSVFGISQDVTMKGLTAQQLHGAGTSGNLEFSGTAEKVEIETTSGDTTLHLTKAPDRVEYDSVSGDLTMTIPKGRCFEVEFDTVSGDFDCAFPKEKSDDDWLFNPEENRFIRGEYEFETVSGDVTIKKG